MQKKSEKSIWEAMVEAPLSLNTHKMIQKVYQDFSHMSEKPLQQMIAGESFSISFDGMEPTHLSLAHQNLQAPVLSVLSSRNSVDDSIYFFSEFLGLRSIVKKMLGSQDSIETKKDAANSATITSVEKYLLQRVFGILASVLSDCLAGTEDILHFQRLDLEPEKSMHLLSGVAIVGKFSIHMDASKVLFLLVIPQKSIQFFLQKQLFVEKDGQKETVKDLFWSKHALKNVKRAHAPISALLAEKKISLRETLHWKSGSTLRLNVHPEAFVKAECEGEEILLGKIGQQKGHLSFRIDRLLWDKNKKGIPDND